MRGSIFPQMRLRRSATHGFAALCVVSFMLRSFPSCLSFFVFSLSLPPPLSRFPSSENNVMIIGLVGHLLSPQMKGAMRMAQMSTGVHRCLHDRLCPRACSAHTCALDVGCTLKGKESSRPIERCNSAISNCTLLTDE